MLDYRRLIILDTNSDVWIPGEVKGLQDYVLGVMEMRFAQLIWRLAPVTTAELVKQCGAEFGWKRTTTYTMLKRLCQRNIFRNEGGTVTALVSEEQFHGKQSEKFVEDTFGGSLPAFIAAFTKCRGLSEREAQEIQRLIDESRERSRNADSGI